MRVLRAIRKKRGIRQGLFCLQAGVVEATLWAYETKVLQKPRATTLSKFCKALNLDLGLASFLIKEVEQLSPEEKKEVGLD